MAGVKKGYSGIGGQAVLEGVMMKNGEKYAVAVRKPDGEITVEVEHYAGLTEGKFIQKIPFIRGIFNFIDSLILGMRALNYSTSFYDEESTKEAARDSKHVSTSESSNGSSVFVMIIAFLLAIGLFVVLPTFIASKFEGIVRNDSLMALIEGGIRIVIFLLYVLVIGLMKDIRRLYQYHGAEHKCINCLEKGRPLTVKNVMRSSRLHKRCGTSFLFLVVFVSVVIFFFVRVDTIWLRFLIRIAMIPVIAGVAYEILRLAGRYNNVFISIISAPGMLIQRLTTREPDKAMVEVAIASVEAVFDWKNYLYETYGYEVTDAWLKDDTDEIRAHADDEELVYAESEESVYAADDELEYVENAETEYADEDFAEADYADEETDNK